MGQSRQKDNNDGPTPFPALPEELIKLIFEHACRPVKPAASTSTAAWASPPAAAPLDLSTSLSIMLVSKAAYNLVVPILYRSVTLSKPSQLNDFANTLLHRPSLGLLTRHLWVGSLNAPTLNFPLIISDAGAAVAAKAHITRGTSSTSSSNKTQLNADEDSRDLVYLEEGVEFASMYVPPIQHRLAESRANEMHSSDVLSEPDPNASSSQHDLTGLPAIKGFGVDRIGMGYDAAGEWIGMDEWMLRCLEVQYAIEFHWEWVQLIGKVEQGEQIVVGGAVCKSDLADKDRKAFAADPMDWADAVSSVTPLPSRARQFSQDSKASSSYESIADKFGFAHLRLFYDLRSAGYAPKEAARILLLKYVQSMTPPGQASISLDDVTNINLLADDSEVDHFLHPALFARSGAIHLIVPAEAPEGVNAPPNAVPAAAAAESAFHDVHVSGDSDSDESNDNEMRTIRQSVRHREGRQAGSGGHQALDFVDLFGHVPSHTRTLHASLYRNSESTNVYRSARTDSASASSPLRSSKSERFRAAAPTLGSLLAKLRSVLTLCPRIRVLGLNGFLERAIGGSRECAGLCELRHLSLGPPPPFWSSALNLDQKSLTGLRTLHISGCMLFHSEAMAIGGYTSALPNLREVDWTLWLGHIVEHPINVVDALTLLLGSGAGPHATSRTIQRHKPLRKVRATLNTEDVEFWNRHAHADIRQDKRLTLRECSSKESEVNLRTVRVWWERKAGIA